ncbi:MAG: putative transcriptional regulator, partial [Caulobacter sp.]|nr:putative transcriptional regulator [Caulobacter sp.]
LQALKPSSLIIRGGDGSVYFARQLGVGEAYRVPQLGGLVIDVTDPEAFQVFAAGRSRGVLPGALVAAGKLEAPAPTATQ